MFDLFDFPPEEKKAVEKPAKYKKQPPIIKQIPTSDKRCGDCANGTFLKYLANMDKNGNPICLQCPFKEFNVARFEKACEKFKKR